MYQTVDLATPKVFVISLMGLHKMCCNSCLSPSSFRMAMFWWCQACTQPACTGWRSRPSQQRVKAQQPAEPSRPLDTKAPWGTVRSERNYLQRRGWFVLISFTIWSCYSWCSSHSSAFVTVLRICICWHLNYSRYYTNVQHHSHPVCSCSCVTHLFALN